jgi:hypothetical protein
MRLQLIKNKLIFSLLIATIVTILVWGYLGIMIKFVGCNFQEFITTWIVGFIITFVIQVGNFEENKNG